MSGIVGKNLGRGSGVVIATPVGADTVDSANIADDAIDSEHYTDGSIDNAHIADDAIDSEHYADGSIDNAHIADDAIDSEHYADGSIDNAHIADDAIDSEHYTDGSIDEAHIADNAVTLAKMAGGTDGNIISFDASGDPVAIATGSDGQVLTSTGAGSPPAFETLAAGGGTLGTECSTASGNTDCTFTGIAAGTKLIIITLDGVSMDITSSVMVVLGDSGGFEGSAYVHLTQMYNSTGPAISSYTQTGAFLLFRPQAADIMYGQIILSLMDSTNNQWGCTGQWKLTNTIMATVAGTKSLSGELTQVKCEIGGPDDWDGGSINIVSYT